MSTRKSKNRRISRGEDPTSAPRSESGPTSEPEIVEVEGPQENAAEVPEEPRTVWSCPGCSMVWYGEEGSYGYHVYRSHQKRHPSHFSNSRVSAKEASRTFKEILV